MLQVLDEPLDLHLALFLGTGHAYIVAEVLLAFRAEFRPQELHKWVNEEGKARFLGILVEDFEKVRRYLCQVVSHRSFDRRD